MPKIFVSYRRSQTAQVTGRIYDRLRKRFPDESIFIDVDSIPLGLDFRKVLGDAVAECDVLLAVISEDWASITDDHGRLRLEDAADYVRVEIESALIRDIPVIPLLIDSATIPQSDELPAALKQLSFRNGTPIRPDPDFHKDIDRLIQSLELFEANVPEATDTATETSGRELTFEESPEVREAKQAVLIGGAAALAPMVVGPVGWLVGFISSVILVGGVMGVISLIAFFNGSQIAVWGPILKGVGIITALYSAFGLFYTGYAFWGLRVFPSSVLRAAVGGVCGFILAGVSLPVVLRITVEAVDRGFELQDIVPADWPWQWFTHFWPPVLGAVIGALAGVLIPVDHKTRSDFLKRGTKAVLDLEDS